MTEEITAQDIAGREAALAGPGADPAALLAAVQKSMESNVDAAENDANDALIAPKNGIKIGDGLTIPRITARTMYLLHKIDSPMVQTPAPGQDPEQMQPATMEDILKAIYVIMNQEDPRVLNVVNDPDALDRCVFEMTGQIDMEDIPKIADALNAQMSGINDAVQQEGLGGQASGGLSGASI